MLKKGNHLILALVVAVNGYLFSCSSNQVEVLNIELAKSGKNINAKEFWTYTYIPTDGDSIFYVERTFNYDTIKYKCSYFISPKFDATYIGTRINDSIYFVPYLLKFKKTEFDFNYFIKNDEMFLDAYASLRWIGIDKNINYYKGLDYRINSDDSLKIGFSNGYMISSISLGETNFKISKIYKTKVRKIKIDKFKYISGFSCPSGKDWDVKY